MFGCQMPFEACKHQVLTKSTVSVIMDWGQIKINAHCIYLTLKADLFPVWSISGAVYCAPRQLFVDGLKDPFVNGLIIIKWIWNYKKY